MKNGVESKQTGNNGFYDHTAVRQAGKKSETRKVLVLPIPLHGALKEVAVREGVKLKTLVKESLLERIRQAEEKKVGEQDPCTTECRYIKAVNPNSIVYTSVYMTREMNHQLRALSHYSHIPEKTLIADALAEYLFKQYGEKYPSAVNQGIVQ